MKKKKILDLNRVLKLGVIACSFILLSLVLIALIPEIVNLIFGEKIIEAHIKEVVGNETNGTIIAQRLMNWIQNNTKAAYNKKRYFNFGSYWGIYNISGKPTLFIRTNKASWFIISKIGNCGEKGWYFAEIMNRLGFRSRVIEVKGEDHVFAEFYENNKKIVVDPSNNEFINNTLERGKGTHWSYIVAIDLSGTKEDITKEYLSNTSILNITINNGGLIRQRTSILINSLYLKKVSKMYHSPINVLAHSFKNEDYLIVNLGSKKDYQLVKLVDFYIIQFREIEDLDLTSNKTIILSPKEVIKIRNVRITLFGYLLSIYSILFLIVFYLLIKKKKQ